MDEPLTQLKRHIRILPHDRTQGISKVAHVHPGAAVVGTLIPEGLQAVTQEIRKPGYEPNTFIEEGIHHGLNPEARRNAGPLASRIYPLAPSVPATCELDRAEVDRKPCCITTSGTVAAGSLVSGHIE